MPNWCENNVEIIGKTETIKNLWEQAYKEELLSTMCPITTPNGEWDYDWCIENWGTKWEVDTDGLEYTDLDDGTAKISGWMHSAWSPPIKAFETFCEANDDVYAEIHYHECGFGFVGYWDSNKGDDCFEYGSKSNLDHIPDALIEEFGLNEIVDADKDETNLTETK